MIDSYGKIVLTVIAAALVALVKLVSGGTGAIGVDVWRSS
jgi:hypothetical protein